MVYGFVGEKWWFGSERICLKITVHYAFSAKNANSLNKFMVMENGIRPGLRLLKQNLHRSMQNTIMRESISVKQRMQLCQKLNRTHSRLACFTEVLLEITNCMISN